ncbi:VacJ family lipoprotein [Kerstersia similis]|uniref:MlaA family lipoprotein n=1 Tax=Kerstersia similis TaxID=206505 RepID=UPI0039F14E14
MNTSQRTGRHWLRPTLLASSLALAGCATVTNPDPRDPFEGFNRGVYQFNDAVDTVILEPLATLYTTITPSPVRSCIGNIFNNIGDVWSAINSLAQGRGHDFINTLGRVMFNTTVGVGGCFDVATANGAYRIRNDFGTTLGVWGLGHGPYIVLPIFGPSSLRDGTGMAVRAVAKLDIATAVDNVRMRNIAWGLEGLDTRASLLDATRTVQATALDPYSFVRDAYFQNRNALLRQKQRPFGASEDDDLPNYDDELPDYDDPGEEALVDTTP